MDILSRSPWPSSALSNFAAREFVFGGLPCGSMEGLLQSWKFEDPVAARRVAALSGWAAKRAGLEAPDWRSEGKLWIDGRAVDRESPAYQENLDRAFAAMFEECEDFRAALAATGSEELEHSIGGTDQAETILTRSELCDRLLRLRARLAPESRGGRP